MQIASSTSAAIATQAARPVQAADPARTAQVGGGDGQDRENDGDKDDGGNVTATRGQNVNILA